jgi:hypothetical protein
MRIDHVIYGTSDLDAAVARLEPVLGVVATGGGRHDGLGTHNRILPLGGGYLEVLAVADRDEAAGSWLGAALLKRLKAGDGLLAWAAAVDDVAAEAKRLGTPMTHISRQGLTARLTAVVQAVREPLLPFFIERDPASADPGAAGGAGGISWLELAGDAARLDAWIGHAKLPVRVVDGAPGVRALGVGARELRD